VIITEPGVYDLDAETYHADPVPGGSLSSSGARRLLQVPPARWRHEQEHPPAPTPAMILGTAVHSLVLGVGIQPVRIDADDWRTKAAKAARDEATRHGRLPLLRDDYDRAYAMATAVLQHPVAGALLDPTRGRPEQTLVWQDEELQVWRRAMVDHLPHDDGRRPILVDLKTTTDAGPPALGRTVAQYGYHQQAAWYLDGYRALHPGSDPAFLFTFVEKEPPHLVSVIELDQHALIVGAELNRRALQIYAECKATGTWPGHSPEIELVGLPAWAARQLEEYA
jgi:hypothetical protein